MKDYNKAWDYFGFGEHTLERLSNAMAASGVVNQRISATYQFIASLRKKSVAQMTKTEMRQAFELRDQLNANKTRKQKTLP